MSIPIIRSCTCAAASRLDRAQAEIRALTGRGTLSAADRLKLARWQREWVAAWRETSGAAA
ncbi:hypothetical protein [Streptantibioticus silvisoli]|uniref:Uncharacterized protein n=1 Tax=Streptantibioticus silvisoli TaxID=2705255 RepID=A0ABT6W4U5_9ACTN|nr:hypothetical protein [Streptantibioticus silvisoli]MDI5965694.1 hypothetical protein [Streptantibioticus silvisoli]